MTTESCAEYRLRLRGNYRDKDMPRYDLNIVIFDTIRYIVPSLMMMMINSPTTKEVQKQCTKTQMVFVHLQELVT